VVDCDSCAVRGLACDDCVVSVLLGPPPERRWDNDELSALDALAGAGLVPPLRLVESVPAPALEDPESDDPEPLDQDQFDRDLFDRNLPDQHLPDQDLPDDQPGRPDAPAEGNGR
jgi:hypothetical protein